MNQLTDPKTGMLVGERQPSLNEIAQQQALDAIGKGKGKGKGKCYNCGEQGHHAWACTKVKTGGEEGGNNGGEALELFALHYKGKGKRRERKGISRALLHLRQERPHSSGMQEQGERMKRQRLDGGRRASPISHAR